MNRTQCLSLFFIDMYQYFVINIYKKFLKQYISYKSVNCKQARGFNKITLTFNITKNVKSQFLRNSIELYLYLAYSPDLNPIKNIQALHRLCFEKATSLFRRMSQ